MFRYNATTALEVDRVLRVVRQRFADVSESAPIHSIFARLRALSAALVVDSATEAQELLDRHHRQDLEQQQQQQQSNKVVGAASAVGDESAVVSGGGSSGGLGEDAVRCVLLLRQDLDQRAISTESLFGR